MIDTFLKWANVTTPWELGLLVFGLVAQALFFGRWVIQWVASEKRGESHMPALFWWLSVVGASMLLVYFILRREPIGALGQSIGWVVYLRNIYLLGKAEKKKDQRSGSGSESDATTPSVVSGGEDQPEGTFHTEPVRAPREARA